MGKNNNCTPFADLGLGSASVGGASLSSSSKRPPTPYVKKRRPGVSNNFNEDDYDFAIVLDPSADYANVADELDFADTAGFDLEEGGVRLGASVVLEKEGKFFVDTPSVFEAAVVEGSTSKR